MRTLPNAEPAGIGNTEGQVLTPLDTDFTVVLVTTDNHQAVTAPLATVLVRVRAIIHVDQIGDGHTHEPEAPKHLLSR